MTPSLDHIRRDDDLLDGLGQRRSTSTDGLALMLSAWTEQVDEDDLPDRMMRRPQRSLRGRIGMRGAAVAAVLGLTLSGAGVAAAMTGTAFPGFSQLGSASRMLFSSGRQGPLPAPGVTSDQRRNDGAPGLGASGAPGLEQADPIPGLEQGLSGDAKTVVPVSPSPAGDAAHTRPHATHAGQPLRVVVVPARPSPTSSTTPSASSSTTPSLSASRTPSPSSSRTPSPSGSAKPSPSGSTTPSPSGSTTPSPSGSTTPSPSGSTKPSPSGSSPGGTPSPSSTPTAKHSPTSSPSDSRTAGSQRDSQPGSHQHRVVATSNGSSQLVGQRNIERKAERKAASSPVGEALQQSAGATGSDTVRQ